MTAAVQISLDFAYPAGNPWPGGKRAVRYAPVGGRWVLESDLEQDPVARPTDCTKGTDLKAILLCIDGLPVSVQVYRGPGIYSMTTKDGHVIRWKVERPDNGRYRIAGTGALEPGTWEPDGYPVWSGLEEDYEAWVDAYDAHNEAMTKQRETA